MSTVYVHHLNALHQKESLTRYLPLSPEMRRAIETGVGELFDAAGGAALLKSSGDVYIKPNGIDAKAYCHTRPELVEAVIRYWFGAGAKRVYLFENSTQSNCTRLVFAASGYLDICRRTGAKPVYLDEEKNIVVDFKGFKRARAGVPESDPESYELSNFEMPRFVAERLIGDRDKNLYISLPKLKTHSMAEVTLGVKNQWAFPRQHDRRQDHNYNLAHKLADILGHVRPDFTIIEGVEATIYGHYPVTALADQCVLPFGVLIGSANVVAADLVGAKLFGLEAEDVPHLKIALDRGYGGDVKSFDDITVVGDISKYTNRYPTRLYDSFPPDVRLVKGGELLCKEGCLNNPLTLLQVLYHDYHGKGGWTLVMGKGHDPIEINKLDGRVLVAGYCAIREVGDALVKRLGRKNVYFSGYCNDLAATAAAMFHLMKVAPTSLIPMPFPKIMLYFFKALLHGTKANLPNPLSHIIKTV
jgi:uncharacterized protein (DUF362 family)